jgi:NAD(P)-dependent dehydrogenase (short-subunit alcohol dehydrogenase family)
VATCVIDAAGLDSLPDGVFHRLVDVVDAAALSGFMDDAVQALGGLNCLVNNAGIASLTGRIEDISLDDVQQCLNICLTSQFIRAVSAVPHQRQSANASIVNVSSLAGRLGFRLRSPYAVAKWGAIGLTKSMAIELGDDGIGVNALLPWLVSGGRQRNVLQAGTDAQGVNFEVAERDAFSKTSIKEYVTPEQLTDQMLYLAGPRGRTISDQAILVCGDTGMLG